MDVFEIITEVRNVTNLHTEKELPTRVLLRAINGAYSRILLPNLYRFVEKKLFRETTLSSQSGETVDVPADAEEIISVLRDGTPCIKVPLYAKERIGQYYGDYLQYPDDDTDHPLFLIEGEVIRIYPELDDTDVKISYKAKIPKLLFGRGRIETVGETTYLYLDEAASLEDDIYNGHYLALYDYDAGIYELIQIEQVTDYDGDNRKATLSQKYSGSKTYFYYASIPIVPDLFHPLLTDATLVELIKTGAYQGNYFSAKQDVVKSIRENAKIYKTYNV